MMNVFHAGDGNLHPLIVFDAREPGIWPRVHDAGDAILRACVDAGGVLSGEHGIGYVQKNYMDIPFNQTQINLMKGIKNLFDPKGILNPGKIFA